MVSVRYQLAVPSFWVARMTTLAECWQGNFGSWPRPAAWGGAGQGRHDLGSRESEIVGSGRATTLWPQRARGMTRRTPSQVLHADQARAPARP